MFSVYRTLSLRFFGRHWVRVALIVASIALGVSTLVATRALNDTMNRAGLASVNPMPGVADFVVSNGELTIPADLAKTLAKIPGVQEAWPRIFENVKLPDLEDRAVLVLGIDRDESQKSAGLDISLTLDPDVKEWTSSVEKLVSYLPVFMRNYAKKLEPAPAVIGEELDRSLKEKNQPRLLAVMKSQTGPRRYLFRVGKVRARGVAAALGGNIVIMDVPGAGRILGLPPGQVNRIDVTLRPGVNRSKVRSEVEEVAKGHGVVRTPDEQNQALGNVMSGMQTGFSLCGLAALVVGLFLVYNALAVCVAERRHEIGVLLSLGATRRQVRWLFAGEAALLGLAGSLLGIPLGVGLAYLGLQPTQQVMTETFFPIEARHVEVGFGLVVLALAAGLLTAVAAALVPAFAASREIPAEAVRRIVKPPSGAYFASQVMISFGMLLLGTGFILYRKELPALIVNIERQLVGWTGLALFSEQQLARLGTYGGMILVLLSALLAAPILTAIVARLLHPLAQALWPIEWRLAADNLVRAPGRTGLVIAALAAGVALVTQTYGTIVSNRTALREWVQEAIAADLIVSSGSPVGAGGGQTQDMKESLVDQIRAIPGIESALPMRFRRVPYRDTQVLLFAIDAAGTYEIELKRQAELKSLHLYKALETPRTAVISDNFAALHRVGKGDTLTLNSASGEVRFLVVGTMEDYSWNHGTIFINRQEYKQFWRESEVNVFDVFVTAGDGRVQAVRETLLQKLGAENGLVVKTRQELQEQIDGMIERLYGIALSQQVVVMFVAALGVVMALMISVMQRRREMGLLRAIGASRAQVVYSILAEAFLMGVIGTLIGFLVGIPLEWYVLKVLILEESGYLFPVYLPWKEGLLILAVGLATPILAGLGPALISVRQGIPDAVAYE